MKTNKNKKGFTLVELLAVIVILALLMILAMPSILKLTENAKYSAFQTALKKMVNTAETTYQSEQLTLEGTRHYTYDVEGLMPGATAYHGCVIMSQDGTGVASSVYVTDGEFASVGANASGSTAEYTSGATKTQVFYKGYCPVGDKSVFSCNNQMPITKIVDSGTGANKTAIQNSIKATCQNAYNPTTNGTSSIKFS